MVIYSILGPQFSFTAPFAFQLLLAGNMLTLFAGAYSSIGLLTFIALSTPYVLTVYLQVPQGEQGAVSGYLHTFQEVIAIAVFGPLGVLADRIGRKQALMLAILIYSVFTAACGFAQTLEQFEGFVVTLHGVGEIAYVQAGTRYTAPARENQGRPVAGGCAVKICRIVGNQFYVQELK